jgi:ethanolaminephosphotransferase
LKYQDNWVYQLSNNGTNTINFFGDDTWMKLFPGLFSRTDGTTSFYVSVSDYTWMFICEFRLKHGCQDTVEVDKNVTRHVLPELQQPDWKALIFHYLGLDHIGHLSGTERYT